ncbi:putative nucleoredoxin 3 [Dorcoceras hygrometricum]|uniref:Putative nucleoredoxin 3 n=1 Tax=Dorcoceras hygrometricum TaxID=472368 RepID=A0A2Z7D0Z2_9LAMI|nr:putative nucleoredoxin 3 [Dorcoceras hygrometricum]
MMTSSHTLEKATSSNVDMLAGFTTEEAEADTVADQGLKRVNRIFGGLNEGIWPKIEELTAQDRKIPVASYSGSSRKLFMTNDWTISCKHIVTTSWTFRRKKFSSSRELQEIQSKATVLCISSRQRIQHKRKAVVDMNQQQSS